MNPSDRELFAKALLEGENRYFAAIPDESAIDLNFSRKFEKKTKRLLRGRSSGKKTARRPIKKALLLAAILILLAALSLTVYAFRESIAKIFLEQYQAFTRYFSSETLDRHSSVEDTARSVRYTLTELPDGFHEQNRYAEDGTVNTVWENQSGEIITMSQYPCDFMFTFDTEDADLQNIALDRPDAHDAYRFTNKGTVCILWNESVYTFVCCFSDSLDLDAMQDLIEHHLEPQ